MKPKNINIGEIIKLSFAEKVEFVDEYFKSNKDDAFMIIIKLIFTADEITKLPKMRNRVKNLKDLLEK